MGAEPPAFKTDPFIEKIASPSDKYMRPARFSLSVRPRLKGSFATSRPQCGDSMEHLRWVEAGGIQRRPWLSGNPGERSRMRFRPHQFGSTLVSRTITARMAR